MAAEDPAIDCRSPEGITVGLIDGMITAARVLRDRDLAHPAVIEALRDIADDEDLRALLAASESNADGPSPVSATTEATGGTTEAQEARE